MKYRIIMFVGACLLLQGATHASDYTSQVVNRLEIASEPIELALVLQSLEAGVLQKIAGNKHCLELLARLTQEQRDCLVDALLAKCVALSQSLNWGCPGVRDALIVKMKKLVQLLENGPNLIFFNWSDNSCATS